MEEPLAPTPPAATPARSPWAIALKALAVAALAGVLGLLAWATLSKGGGSSLVAKVAAGKKPQAPSFELSVLWPKSETWPRSAMGALADGKIDLEELRGHPVVINFWASWCIPCRDEAPILHASALRHKGVVAFLGIDVQDLSSDARAFARKYEVNYVSVRNGDGSVGTRYGTTGIPESYFIDAQGRIVAHIPGAVSRETLEEGIAAITVPAAAGGTLRGGEHVQR